MSSGVIFDIKEMAVFDGPGIRTTVFFKGCNMRCRWCHNPEGFCFEPQLMVSSMGCSNCGQCLSVCSCSVHTTQRPPKDCNLCGRCISVCPQGIRRISGAEYTATDLANMLLRDAPYLKNNDGGYTVSGGEPTAQGEFLLELLGKLRGNHRVMETSGFCSGELFREVLEELELVLMDIKLINPEKHRYYTGVDNSLILENLKLLKRSGKPHIIRIPVIPAVNDCEENYNAIAELLHDNKNLLQVELLPYHKTAGAKYGMLNMEYNPEFDTERMPYLNITGFTSRNIPCSVL